MKVLLNYLRLNRSPDLHDRRHDAGTNNRPLPGTPVIGAPALEHADRSQRVLSDGGRYRFAAQHALTIRSANAIYSFIPKNACSTMRYSLALANGCISGETDIGWIHRNNATFRANLQELIAAEYTFIILRCPFARLASFYLDKLVTARPIDRTHVGKAYLAMSSRKDEDITFEDFVRDLEEKNLVSRNMHWRPQSDFLVYSEYDDYFCVEDFATAERALRERIGLEIHDTRPLLDRHGGHYEKIGCASEYSLTPAPELAKLKRIGKVPELRALYSDASIARVRRIFAADCVLFRERCGRRTTFDS
ncbi:MAG: sulfotransferase family 2 domain-containing protein [Rhizomicrobium sp.]